jgi:hypothetical protein
MVLPIWAMAHLAAARVPLLALWPGALPYTAQKELPAVLPAAHIQPPTITQVQEVGVVPMWPAVLVIPAEVAVAVLVDRPLSVVQQQIMAEVVVVAPPVQILEG